MKRWRNKALLLAGVAALAAAIPAFSQDAPESLLPPGFEEPAQEAPANVQAPALPATPAPPSAPALGDEIVDAAAEDLEALEDTEIVPPIEIPDHARRPIDVVGPLGPADKGLGEGAFGSANGRFVSTLMRRIDAPVPSRWASILLRRALLSRVPAPSHVHPVDWVAERAWLLLRMGEADAARMLVQSVDVDQFTPKMFSVAVQAALATADPAALCPLVEPGRETSREPVWDLSDAMCASLAGEASRASALIDQARRRGTARGIDLLLTEKIVGAGTNTRRSVTVEWDGVEGLNSWRFGLASATGLEIPAPLLNGAGPRIRAWHARAPMVPVDQRALSAEQAAAMGVFSNAALVEMYSLIADNTDVAEMNGTVGQRLRNAYAGRTLDARMDAIRSLWNDEASGGPYARQILTAGAAARLAPSDALGEAAPSLIASMLSAGMDDRAERWVPFVSGLDGDVGERAWALLAVGAPRPQLSVSQGRISSYGDGGVRARMLFAALAGLGRIDEDMQASLADELGVPIARENLWTRSLEAAVRGRQPGTVAVLAAAGMQTSSWNGVPPDHLYRIVRALRGVGLQYEARMIAAEALSRL